MNTTMDVDGNLAEVVGEVMDRMMEFQIFLENPKVDEVITN